MLLAAVAGAAWLGHGRLAGPPLGRPGTWSHWVNNLGPVVATFSILRMAVLAGASYLLLAAGVALADRAIQTRWPRRPVSRLLAVTARVVAPRLALRLALGVAGTTMAAGTAVAPVASATPVTAVAATSPPAAPPTLTPVPAGPPTLTPVPGGPPTLTPVPAGPPTLTPVPARPPTLTPVPADLPGTSPVQSPATSTPAGPVTPTGPGGSQPNAHQQLPIPAPGPVHHTGTAAPAPPRLAAGSQRTGVWVVRAGDSLWSIAAQTARSHGVTSQEAIGAYWWRVVTLNRPLLPDPDHPDLLFPGDMVRLPPF